MTIRLSKNGKRLGRPPKNAEKATSTVFTVEPKKYEPPVFDILDDNMIECKFTQINEFSHVKNEITRSGRYAQSTYSLNKYGKNSYVVLAYIEADIEKHRSSGVSDEQIIQRCVNYLNQSEKKKGKKEGFKPYGNLQLYNYRVINKYNKDLFVVELVTDHKSNENFWGVGNR